MQDNLNYQKTVKTKRKDSIPELVAGLRLQRRKDSKPWERTDKRRAYE
jgi:hypothetical protein